MNSAATKFTLLFVFCIVPEITAFTDDQFADERSDLIQLRDSLSSTKNLHSNWTGPPCFQNRSRWFGIACRNSRVIGIYLAGIQLTGSLSSTVLQNLRGLTYLNLSNNALHGNLPTLKGLRKLLEVSFAGNRFSGAIPVEFVGLPNLTQLELQDNLLNSTIPPLNQRSLSLFNVSVNFLQGPIPETHALQRFLGNSFLENLELCGGPLNKPCGPRTSVNPTTGASPPPQTSPSTHHARASHHKLKLWVIIAIVLCSFWGLYAVFLCLWLVYKYHKQRTIQACSPGDARKKNGSETTKEDDLEFIQRESSSSFNLSDLLGSSAEILGKGQLGSTYKTMLASGPVVAVKRLKDIDETSRKDFTRLMQMLGKLKHENLVEIISFYHSTDQKLVLYEHIRGSSLFQLLHENRGEGRIPLKWAARIKIVKGIAQGLAYLHQSLPSHKIPHGNLKSSNILVDHDDSYKQIYQTKLTDYGFQPLFSSDQYVQKLAIAKAPEYIQGKRKITAKADVFCFGLILIEIINGVVVPSDHEENNNLWSWARSIVSNWSMDVVDLELVAENLLVHEEIRKLAEIAVDCTELEQEKRPSMSKVAERVLGIKEVCVEMENFLPYL